MSLLDSIKIALSSILAHKLRSALTMLGIIIGVGSIITVVAIGQGGEAALKAQFAGGGNNTMQITFKPETENVFAMPFNQQPTFTQEDIWKLKQIPEIENVITVNTSTEVMDHNDKKETVQLTGITNDYFAVQKLILTKGNQISSQDFIQFTNVMMVNQKAADDLFPHENPVGKVLELKGQPFQITGVYKSRDDVLGVGIPQAILPLSLWPVLYGTDNIQTVTIQAKNATEMEAAGKKAVNMLNDRRTDDVKGKYEIFNLAEIQKSISKVTAIMTSVIGGIAGISLLVGGIGVMNIMLVSVTERTSEIGIRKALGATREKILLQFLIESMMLTLLGGMIGIALGVGGAYLVSTFAKWPPLVSWQVVLGGVLFSILIGIIFGLIPANKAAKLDPIEALRYE